MAANLFILLCLMCFAPTAVNSNTGIQHFQSHRVPAFWSVMNLGRSGVLQLISHSRNIANIFFVATGHILNMAVEEPQTGLVLQLR